jgi:hypothetical protein
LQFGGGKPYRVLGLARERLAGALVGTIVRRPAAFEARAEAFGKSMEAMSAEMEAAALDYWLMLATPATAELEHMLTRRGYLSEGIRHTRLFKTLLY